MEDGRRSRTEWAMASKATLISMTMVNKLESGAIRRWSGVLRRLVLVLRRG